MRNAPVAAFKRAFVTQDVAAWSTFFADDAEWIECRPSRPPRSPRQVEVEAWD